MRINRNHLLALTAAGAVVLGATAASAQSYPYDPSPSVQRFGNPQGYYHNRGPLSYPGAALGAAGTVAGGVIAGGGHLAGSIVGGPAYGAYAYDNPYGAYASSPFGYRDSLATPGFNAPSGAARGQHYETPIGYGSIYTNPAW